MDNSNFWARAPAQLTYPEPYRMVHTRMMEPRFPSNSHFYRGAVDFSNYFQQPVFPFPQNMGYAHSQSYYQPDDIGYHYERQSKWNDHQPSSFQNAFPSGKERFTYNSTQSHSNFAPYESSPNSQSFPSKTQMQQPGNASRTVQNSNTVYSLKPVPYAEKVPTNNKAVEKLRTPGTDGPQSKIRRLNPPMPMLPPPRVKADSKNTNVKASEGKLQSIAQKGGPLPSALVLSNTRVMAGSIQQLLKWNAILHKAPPLYETAGYLTNFRSPSGKGIVEYHFCLRNLQEWHKDERGSEAKLLDCIIYAEPESLVMPHSGTIVRVVGRFQPAGVFQCLKVRKAAEDDLQYLKTKLGLLDQNRKVELLSYGLNGSLNSSVARGTSCLSGLDTLCRAPIVANPFLAATGEGDP